ncbi:hypothetical protein D3C87_657890 [compost metagenome]
MSLKELSQHAAKHGRNGDTELLHVSKDELKTMQGLASLGGTRLTTNPHTGLPEAFNLGGLFRQILPVVAGVAGTMIGGPAVGALASGATTAATTGSLEKGLMAGMGSYALGGLGNAALGAGASNLAGGAAEAATQAGTEAATQAATQGAQEAASQAAAQGLGQGAAMGPGIGTAESLSQSFPNLTPAQITQVTSEGTPDLMAQRAAMLNQFGQANYNMAPSGAITQAPPIGGQFAPTTMEKLGALTPGDMMNVAAQNPMGVLAGGSMLASALTPEQQAPGGDGSTIGASLDPNYFRNLGRQQQARGFASGGLAALNPKSVGPVAFDAGGPVPSSFDNQMFPQAGVQSPMYAQATQAPMERAVLRSGYGPMTDPGTGDQTFAQGGLAQLNQGRAIRGPGDGMSDDIPAHIGGVEPAALADGEYVLPADVVSHLGNGSTEAGTRKLDGMMARIRQARTGNAKQGKQIKADKYLPA